MSSIPYLKEQNGKKVLMVNDEPFIMLAGEVHNSNSSSVEYMEGVWEKADALGMNCLLLPVTWELTEPEEGVFDFSLVDGLIAQARARGKRLAFLWFGAWKNAQCYYAPAWVKKDMERFRRAEVEKGERFTRIESFHGMSYTTLSYLCDATREADARAFAELMRHIRAVDAAENTVITVQVENETGLMGAAREHSDEADARFAGAVPQEFADYLRAHMEMLSEDIAAAVASGAAQGSWEEVFGSAAEELFSAYHVAGYVGAVAAAGKEVYPLPMSANCWLNQGGEAGTYPSGGPVARVMGVWRYAAPAIDVLAPDIYVQNFTEICEEYAKCGNPLYIPETATHGHCGPREVYTVGRHHAMCYSPFGFEDMGGEFTASMGFLFGMDTSDPLLAMLQDVEEYRWYTDTLRSMMPLLTERYGTKKLQAVIAERPDDDTMVFGTYGFKALMSGPMIQRNDGVCLVLQESEDTFYVVANGCMLVPFSADQEKPYLDILAFEDGRFENGEWKRQRRLNGDEAAIMRYGEPVLLRIQLFAYC